MNNEVKFLWVSKLRSKEYRQGTGRLKTGDKFCCLGVLCDLYVKKTGIEWNATSTLWSTFGALPDEVSMWAGLGDIHDPCVDVKDGAQTVRRALSEMNDQGSTFAEIADLIEAQL